MRTLVIALVFSVLALAVSAHAQTATLTMLPEGFRIGSGSGDGRIVLVWAQDATPPYAATWTREAGIQPLPTPVGWGATRAFDASFDGRVIVGEAVTPAGPRAFVYTPETGMVQLGVLPGASRSTARGVSSNGRWVCGTCDAMAFRFDRVQGVMEPLRTTSGEDSWVASAVSNDGRVVGTAFSDIGRRSEPIEWPTPSVANQLGPRWGNTWGGAYSITPDGQWVIGTTDSPFIGQLMSPYPVVWDSARAPMGLLAPGTPFSFGATLTSMTNDGMAAFGILDQSGAPDVAGVWTKQQGMLRLWPVLQSRFGLQSALGEPISCGIASESGVTLLLLWQAPIPSQSRFGIVDWPAYCAADCMLDWQLDIFDFLCFLNKYAENDPYACEFELGGASTCSLFDFLAFQSYFTWGCELR